MSTKLQKHRALCGYAAHGKPCAICKKLEKDSPSAPGRSNPLVGSSVAPGANSSERAADQEPTPGEKRIGTSTSNLHRRAKDSGDAFEERLKET